LDAVTADEKVVRPGKVVVIAALPMVTPEAVIVPMPMVMAVAVSYSGELVRVDTLKALAFMVVTAVTMPMVNAFTFVVAMVIGPTLSLSITGVFKRVVTFTAAPFIAIPVVVALPMLMAVEVTELRLRPPGNVVVVANLPIVSAVVATFVPIFKVPAASSDVAVAAPMFGVVRFGDVPNTSKPVPVSSEITPAS
jgi:hypothetical protein